MTLLKVKKGASKAKDPIQAIEELCAALYDQDNSLVIFFTSIEYDLNLIETALQGVFNCPVIGCTTAGEISSEIGYNAGGIVGASLSSKHLVAHTKLIYPLSEYNFAEIKNLANEFRSELVMNSDFDSSRMFNILLIDGLSLLEEVAAASLSTAFGGVSLVGGSAGDGQQFLDTFVYSNGKFYKNAASITLIETTLPFKIIHIQNFEATNKRLVVTESDGAIRTVTEINGESPAQEYAAAVGVDISEFTPKLFGANPLMLKVGGTDYVRSIQKVNPDGSISFYCAIDNGLVLRVGRVKGVIENLKENLLNLREDMPTLKIVIGFECVFRRFELQRSDLVEEAEEVLKMIDFIGFSTYGEQINGLHVNQTLTAVAIGE